MLVLRKKWILFSLGLLSSVAWAIKAEPITDKHIVVAPQCLVNKLNVNMTYKTLSSSPALTLLETNTAGIDFLIEAKNIRTKTPCGSFIDVTDAWNHFKSDNIKPSHRAGVFLEKYEDKTTLTPPTKKSNLSYVIKYEAEVNQLLKLINPEMMWANLTTFSNTNNDQFPDRYANSTTGVKAANWLKEKIETLAKENNRTDITAYTVATGTQYKQPSVVVKIGDSNEPGIVIGGHMDTLSSSWELKPGADDDGSGSMTVMEIARTLISSNMQFKKPIYIIWYSAEEMGLVGSSYVVKDFKNKNIPVDAVLQFDMTGYAYQNDPTLWLITDNVSSELTSYLETLIKTYVKQPVGRTRCGYACSDHASWNKAGFSAAFPFESSFGNDDPYIHTANDTMSVLSKSHMTDYVKLGIAFAVELAEPLA